MAEDRDYIGPKRTEAVQGFSSDLLRSMIVFADAGLDTTLKQLIRDALPAVVVADKAAQGKFLSFSEGEVNTETNKGRKVLAGLLTQERPRDALIERYIARLTGSSLQSVEQIGEVAGALGVTDDRLRRRIDLLKPLFEARNQVVHELDLLAPGKHGDRRRRERELDEVVGLSNLALEMGQQLVNAVVEKLTISASS